MSTEEATTTLELLGEQREFRSPTGLTAMADVWSVYQLIAHDQTRAAAAAIGLCLRGAWPGEGRRPTLKQHNHDAGEYAAAVIASLRGAGAPMMRIIAVGSVVWAQCIATEAMTEEEVSAAEDFSADFTSTD